MNGWYNTMGIGRVGGSAGVAVCVLVAVAAVAPGLAAPGAKGTTGGGQPIAPAPRPPPPPPPAPRRPRLRAGGGGAPPPADPPPGGGRPRSLPGDRPGPRVARGVRPPAIVGRSGLASRATAMHARGRAAIRAQPRRPSPSGGPCEAK